MDSSGTEIAVAYLLDDILDAFAFFVIDEEVDARAYVRGHGTSGGEGHLFNLINGQGEVALGRIRGLVGKVKFLAGG